MKSINKIEIGDRVYRNGDIRSGIGTVLFDDENNLLIEFDEYRSHFHNGDGRGKDGYCWWVFREYLTKVENTYEIY